jgi:hypothetical protein
VGLENNIREDFMAKKIEKIGKCFFCGIVVMPDQHYDMKQIHKLLAKYGHYEKLGGTVGDKHICKACVSKLKDILEVPRILVDY